MQYTSEQIHIARRADLYQYLLRYHPNLFKVEGQSIHPKDNLSLSIKKGYSGYKDFATDETGNGIDYLTKYLSYTVPEAVNALCGGLVSTNDDGNSTLLQPTSIELSNTPLNVPPPANCRYRQLFAYLMRRGIPAKTIQALIDQHLLYQESAHNNIIFINKEQDFAEFHGTLTYGKPFHSCRKLAPDRFWWFRESSNAHTAYICEAAIDAISLYELNKPNDCPAYYISLGGVANQQSIDRIKRQQFLHNIMLAVDNDVAGQKCRERNKDLACIIPNHKDWNEDLMARINFRQ
ncbi:toprim domain-containing protein [Butyrivibrio sp. NC2007]|uniref:toprim domain-containing protein n=1 Tax=Butyrivibrio sp. NC2007 TaxID=1280683 RepID=UPI0003B367B9|nr:toprim domain-containing protein [Butyrivibrio sp. NC2007]